MYYPRKDIIDLLIYGIDNNNMHSMHKWITLGDNFDIDHYDLSSSTYMQSMEKQNLPSTYLDIWAAAVLPGAFLSIFPSLT